jgi:putative DNA primase/helicase
MPAFKDVSGALKGRIMPLSTSRSFYGEENQTLTEELIDELPGILNWAIKGWRKLKKRGRFVQPKQNIVRSNGKCNPEFADSLLGMRT